MFFKKEDDEHCKKNEEKKQSMIASKNIKVKKEVIYSSANLIMHCLLQLTFTR